MSIAKEELKKIIDNLPDDLTKRDIIYHLYFMEKLSNAEEDIKQGKIHSNGQIMEEMEK